MKILVIGAGFLGTEILNVATARGLSAIGTRRKSYPDFIALDVISKDGFYNIPADVECIIYSVSASSSSERAYREAYVEGLQNILAFITSNKDKFPLFKKFVFISSTGIYSEDSGNIVDETTDITENSFRADILNKAENTLSQFLPDNSILIMRFSGIYGPGRNYFIEKARTMSDYSIENDTWTNRIHRHDGARAIVHLLKSPENEAGIFNITDTEPASRIEVLQFIRDLVNMQPLKFRLLNNELNGKRCSSKKLLKTDFTFKYPTFREGYKSYFD